jgi:hypothetical protein|nr:MAG TPA: hypothetical protein [Caudoviricetes sp.]
MNPKNLKELILSLTQDVVFEYDGAVACINPWNAKKIEVGYDDKMKTYDNIDDVMNDPIYHGKSLQEISEQLSID